MKRLTQKIEVGASQIQERVARLAEQFSQSEISRRTNTPVSNVNRYINGTRVPADFCGALVQGMGVNPAWLLAGEGAPFLSDVTAGTQGMAGEMLELVDALNAVARMRLGSLTGKHHLRVLRELNDALTTYQGLRDKLNERSGPILTQLTTDLIAATRRQQWDVASDLRRAGEQIAEFCHDREMQRAFLAASAILEYATGQPDKALTIGRSVFALTLTGTDQLTDNAITQAHNMVASLCQHYLFDEARRVARASQELAGDRLHEMEAGHELCTLSGVVDVELGHLKDGLAAIATHFPRTSPVYIEQSAAPVLRAFLLSGFMSFDEVDARGGITLGKARHLLRFAVWLEDPERLQRTCERYSGTMPRPDSLEAVQAELLAGAMKRPRKSDLKPAIRRLEAADHYTLPASVAAVIRAAYSAQLAWHHRDQSAATAHVMRTAELAGELKPGVSLDLLLRATIHRNALRILPEDAKGEQAAVRGRAKAFVAQHLRRGYNFLAALQ